MVSIWVATGLIPITAVLRMFSPVRLAPFSNTPFFKQLNHLLLATLYHLESRTTVKTVQLLLHRQQGSGKAASDEDAEVMAVSMAC